MRGLLTAQFDFGPIQRAPGLREPEQENKIAAFSLSWCKQTQMLLGPIPCEASEQHAAAPNFNSSARISKGKMQKPYLPSWLRFNQNKTWREDEAGEATAVEHQHEM
jgi:hypothetical protein